MVLIPVEEVKAGVREAWPSAEGGLGKFIAKVVVGVGLAEVELLRVGQLLEARPDGGGGGAQRGEHLGELVELALPVEERLL
eukprot:scaffold176006_cov31-Prasinocladus_malaysianus.AAC.1